MREAQRALAEEIRKLPPDGGEHVGFMGVVLAASVELGKALGGHEGGCRDGGLEQALNRKSEGNERALGVHDSYCTRRRWVEVKRAME